MKISDSIAQGILSGGSQTPSGSPMNRQWNRAWSRFFDECAKHLLAYLSGRFPNLNHADAGDVLSPALMKVYRSLKREFDPAKHKMEHWIFRAAECTALDLLRKKGRISKHEAMTLDAELEGMDGLQLHEVIGAEDPGFGASEAAEVKVERLDVNELIMQALEKHGLRSTESIAIFRALLSGSKPKEIMEQFGISRGKVDNLKGEMKKQLAAITQLLTKGIPLEVAVKSTRAKNNA